MFFNSFHFPGHSPVGLRSVQGNDGACLDEEQPQPCSSSSVPTTTSAPPHQAGAHPLQSHSSPPASPLCLPCPPHLLCSTSSPPRCSPVHCPQGSHGRRHRQPQDSKLGRLPDHQPAGGAGVRGVAREHQLEGGRPLSELPLHSQAGSAGQGDQQVGEGQPVPLPADKRPGSVEF